MKSNILKERFKNIDTSGIRMYKKDIQTDLFKDFHINGEIINTKMF